MRCFDFGCIEVCDYGWCFTFAWVLVIIDLRFVGCLFGACVGLVACWCLLVSALDYCWVVYGVL